MPSLKFLAVNATTKHTATAIFLHGLGDSGHGWEPLADTFNSDPNLQHVKWIFPHAPARAVYVNGGHKMPAWFDIMGVGLGDYPEDEGGTMESDKGINEIIDAEVEAGIDPNRIVLGGFSQGAAMTLFTGLTTKTKLAGLVAFSGWLPLRNKVKSVLSSHATSLPVLFGHGTLDPVVPFEAGRLSAEFLKSDLGFPAASVDFQTCRGMGHSSSPEEIEHLRKWLIEVLPGDKSSKS